MRVLVAEDEPFLARMLAEGLRKQAMAVDVVHDGGAALDRLDLNRYDVLVLDRDLPVVHGDDVCRRLAGRADTLRILMLTAKAGVRERVAGLNLGSDDYLVKPFAFDELVARINALGRRAADPLPPVIERAGITVDTGRREVRRDGRPIALTNKEYAVLEVLMQARGAVVSAEDLLERAWDENTDPFTGVVKVIMSKLRAKLGGPPVIVTLPGAGYRL